MAIETAHGDVGIIHAGPVLRRSTRTVAELERVSAEAFETALLGGDKDAGSTWRGERGEKKVKGVR